MSRVARIPVTVAKGVDVQITDSNITVKGPLGTLHQALSGRVKVELADGQVSFAAADESREANAMSGTMRALVAAMVQGVSKGFEKKLYAGRRRLSRPGTGRQAEPVAGLLAPGRASDARRCEVRNADPDRDRHQGRRQAESRPGRGRSAWLQAAGALQGQGRALRRRGRGHQRDQEEVRRREVNMIEKKETRLRRARATRARIALQKTDASDGQSHQPAHLRQRHFRRWRQGAGVGVDRRAGSQDATGDRQGQGRQCRRGQGRRRADRPEGEGSRHRERGFRPRGLPIPWSGQGAGGCRA